MASRDFPVRPGGGLRPWIVPAISAAAAVLLLVPVFGAPLYWDDHVHLFLGARLPASWPLLHGLAGVYFRPAGEMILWAIARLAGPSPAVCHLAGAVAAGATAAAVAGLVGRETGDGHAALAAGALFAASPSAVVSGAWLSNIYALLAVLSGAAALLVIRRPVLAVLLALSAGLAREEGFFWMPAVLVMIASKERTPRRLVPPFALALSGSVMAAAWRWTVLGGAGGMTPLRRLPHAIPAALAAAAAVAFTALGAFRLRSPLARAAVIVTVPSLFLGLALHRLLPTDPHGLWLRLFLLPTAGAAILVGLLLATSARRTRKTAFAAVGVLVLLLAWRAGRWEDRWLVATRGSAALVEATFETLAGRPDLEGPVWIAGAGDEIALAAAVGLRDEAILERTVPLRPTGANLLVCPDPWWPAVRSHIRLAPIPGNPVHAGRWVAALAFGRGEPGGVPVLAVTESGR